MATKRVLNDGLSGYSSANSCRAMRLLLPPIVSYMYACGWRLSKQSSGGTHASPTRGLTGVAWLSRISFFNWSMKSRSGSLKSLLSFGLFNRFNGISCNPVWSRQPKIILHYQISSSGARALIVYSRYVLVVTRAKRTTKINVGRDLWTTLLMRMLIINGGGVLHAAFHYNIVR